MDDIKKEDKKFKIDLHVHTNEYSSCSIATPEELIESAIRKNIDGLVFTEHDKLFSDRRLKELNERYAPFKIFSGIEISIEDDKNNIEHVVVLGVHDNTIEERKWDYAGLYNFVKEHNGIIILAHPYRYRDFVICNVENYPPDAIEIFSSNLDNEKLEKRLELCRLTGASRVTNSDGHSVDKVAIYYNLFDKTPENEKELIDMFRNREYTALYN